ncbi:hypothetical protein [Capnocytophaga canis]|uniref:Uncharacterized protein n=1 Tax=Capnocytophaga canis TaxID=1848903 RepID=A0A0B7IWE5_9FLAO|nr:hypothetical protein [Capnocytophaga canis]CEN54432.1 conserved hypothetical protein [Capnocytophaga canis]
MKYAKLAAVLAVTEIVAKKPLMGGEAKASFTEEQLEKIENALAEKDTSALEQELATLKEEKSQFQEEVSGFRASVTQALTDNKLEASEDLNADIALLGKTCKEYGDKGNGHTPTPNDGKEKENEFEGVVDMNDAHNQSVK